MGVGIWWGRRDNSAMFDQTIDYLREIAQRCTRLARDCPHVTTAHALEELGLDLMHKAQELEQRSGRNCL